MIDHSKIQECRRQDMEFLDSLEVGDSFPKALKVGKWKNTKLCSECHRPAPRGDCNAMRCCPCCGFDLGYRRDCAYDGAMCWLTLSYGSWRNLWKSEGCWEYRTQRGIERRKAR